MQTIAFCTRCRRVSVGWNARYIVHSLICKERISRSYKLLIVTALMATLAFALPPSEQASSQVSPSAIALDTATRRAAAAMRSDSAVKAIDAFLEDQGVNGTHRGRAA